jgi:hypothetical protein
MIQQNESTIDLERINYQKELAEIQERLTREISNLKIEKEELAL